MDFCSLETLPSMLQLTQDRPMPHLFPRLLQFVVEHFEGPARTLSPECIEFFQTHPQQKRLLLKAARGQHVRFGWVYRASRRRLHMPLVPARKSALASFFHRLSEPPPPRVRPLRGKAAPKAEAETDWESGIRDLCHPDCR